ncbi:hypothetical protein B0H10DRAFT_1810885, partial [Mycena sp. CBHHK59/15]
WATQVFYSRLEEILVCRLLEDKFWEYMSGKTWILAVITPCSTFGKDASKEITSYTIMTRPIVIDIWMIVAVVGQVETRGQWIIIDQGGGLLHPAFVTQ